MGAKNRSWDASDGCWTIAANGSSAAMDEQPVRRGRDVLQKPRPRTRQRQPDFCDIFLDTYRGSSKRHTEEDRACSVEQADDSQPRSVGAAHSGFIGRLDGCWVGSRDREGDSKDLRRVAVTQCLHERDERLLVGIAQPNIAELIGICGGRILRLGPVSLPSKGRRHIASIVEVHNLL